MKVFALVGIGIALFEMVIAVPLGHSSAQDAPPSLPPGFGGPRVVSPEVAADRRVTFRILAPKSTSVRLSSFDIPGIGWGVDLKKGDNGIWTVTTQSIDPGAYRYHFEVDTLAMNDPQNPTMSESNSNSWSLFTIPGSDAQDTKDVPHGAVAEVQYLSSTLKQFRRMHVYTPPGYELGKTSLPVLYLLHGATDSDDSWSTVGRAGFILDNLIAAGRARPMVIVMPNGHTAPFRFGPPDGENGLGKQIEDFVKDFVTDLRPHVEKTYRIRKDRAGRAIAGLSMGGAQTLEIAIRNLADYGYLGIFSSGVFGIAGGPFQPPGPKWVELHQHALQDAELKPGLKLVWFAIGKDDFLRTTSTGTVDAMKKHGFNVVYHETSGGHTWANWRDYLHDFAPLLFNEPSTLESTP